MSAQPTNPTSWAVIYGTHRGDAIFEDESGHARVPLRALHMLHHVAKRTRSGFATWAGPPERRFQVDNLAAVLRDYENDELAALDTCAYSDQYVTCDEAAPFNLADTRPACHNHAKDA